MTNTCAIPGCDMVVGREKLMCGPHWRRLPSDAQANVYSTWNRMRRSLRERKDRPEDQLVAIRNYNAAREAAIDKVQRLMLGAKMRLEGRRIQREG